MSQRISRREFAKRATLGATALAMPGLAGVAQPEDPAKELAALERELNKPLSKQARELAVEAIKQLRRLHAARMLFPLPENSEPCTMYVATPAKGRAK